jgi:multidrug transporter EmrE-like cation transporter
MTPRAISFLILLAAIGINLSGETVLKSGLNRIGEIELTPVGLYRVFTTPAIILGFALVFGAAVVWLKVISREPLSWAYPMLALGYLPLQFSSHRFLGEEISLQRLVGVAVVIVGVVLVFRS